MLATMKRRWYIRTLMVVVALVALGLGVFLVLADNQRLRTKLAAYEASRRRAEVTERRLRNQIVAAAELLASEEDRRIRAEQERRANPVPQDITQHSN